MLAPEPFFQPRGTPISVYFRLKALTDLGHQVDLITYPLGEDKQIPGVKIHRLPNLFGLKKIKIGPSSVKIPLDGLLTGTSLFYLTKERYHLIFTHEEASWIGTLLAKIWSIPHIYDMHSSLPQQLTNFNFSRSTLLKNLFSWLEKWVLRNSQAIIVICPDLLRTVTKEGQKEKTVLLENFIDFEYPLPEDKELAALRKRYASSDEKIILYAGNFLPYQGIPCLLEAMGFLPEEKAKLLLLGGSSKDVEKMKQKAHRLSVLSRVIFLGEMPPEKVPAFIAISDILVSPRVAGTNTPLKIYTFLKSGKPIVATNLWTHTQLLTEEHAVLVPPTPKGLADGLSFALKNKEAKLKAERAQKWALQNFTYVKYLEKINKILQIAHSNLESSQTDPA
ncbi:MAG: glycosyltransferase family 4 protein [Acidobacteriota bacterium]